MSNYHNDGKHIMQCRCFRLVCWTCAFCLTSLTLPFFKLHSTDLDYSKCTYIQTLATALSYCAVLLSLSPNQLQWTAQETMLNQICCGQIHANVSTTASNNRDHFHPIRFDCCVPFGYQTLAYAILCASNDHQRWLFPFA